MKRQQQNNLFMGLFLLVLGALFLMNNLGFDIDIGDIFLTYWPLILIFVGLKNLLPHLYKKKQEESSGSGSQDSQQ